MRSWWASDPGAPDLVMLDLATLAGDLQQVTVEVTADGLPVGSAVLWPAGFVVTNAHVVRQRRLTLRVAGRELVGQLMARDRGADLALVRIHGNGFRTATTADDDSLRVGALVVAVGHPFGVRGALTAGIVHRIGPLAAGGRSWIQADLRLAPGNSGGPLADASGRLVGINSMIAGQLALAVPMNEVRKFVRAAGLQAP